MVCIHLNKLHALILAEDVKVRKSAWELGFQGSGAQTRSMIYESISPEIQFCWIMPSLVLGIPVGLPQLAKNALSVPEDHGLHDSFPPGNASMQVFGELGDIRAVE